MRQAAQILTLQLVVLLGLMGNAATAAIINGGFETGSFQGWQTVGGTTIQSSSFEPGPTEGQHQALLTVDSGFGSIPASFGRATFDAFPFMALPFSDIDEFIDFVGGTGIRLTLPRSGSVIKQRVRVERASRLSFDLNYLTDEGYSNIDSGLNIDYAFYYLTGIGVGFSAIELFNEAPNASTPNVTCPSDPGCSEFLNDQFYFKYESGFFSTDIFIPKSGVYEIGFAVFHTGDTLVASGLLVDNISLVEVAEPGTLSLMWIGLLGLGWMDRRRRRS